jgi:hypothetical protein
VLSLHLLAQRLAAGAAKRWQEQLLLDREVWLELALEPSAQRVPVLLGPLDHRAELARQHERLVMLGRETVESGIALH